jgi:hypothetical protein
MKAAYVGSVRGYQSPIYRPGIGWTGGSAGRGPAVFARRRSTGIGPFTISQHRRTSFRTKVLIVSVAVTIIALLAILYGGGAQL